MNKVVARFADGRTIKGSTMDFHPAKESFHLLDAAAPPGANPVEIRMRELKAVFFVKDLVGDPQRVKAQEPGLLRPAAGRRVRVVFKDGEVMEGTTANYQPGRQGFVLEPTDASLNEERCYVLTKATRQITFL